MKIRNLIISCSIAIAPAFANAEDVSRITVTGDQAKSSMSMDDRAVNACFQEFIAEILPGSQANIKVSNSTSSQVFAASTWNPNLRMDVSMQAKSAETGELLASARCEVDRRAAVRDLRTNIKDADALASLTLSDVQMVASIR